MPVFRRLVTPDLIDYNFSLLKNARRFFFGILCLAAGCRAPGNSAASAPSDLKLAERIARGLLDACPSLRADEESARSACAQKLQELAPLRDAMSEPFLWGAQAAEGDFHLDHQRVTRFNPLVFRKLYLSLYAFDGGHRVEQAAPFTVLRMPCRFRGSLDIGSFPYPFWHSKDKWESYQTAADLLFILEAGKVKGALRSARRDPSRPLVTRDWDRRWTWRSAANQDEPRAALYSALLSKGNPHLPELDAAYRGLELRFRQYHCMECHGPDNPAGVAQLELFSYPNQALSARHTMARALEENTMPPKKWVLGRAGIRNETERQALAALARTFEKAADDALAYEKEARP